MNRIVGVCGLLAACAFAATAETGATKNMVEQGRKLAAEVSLALRSQLIKEMQISGPVRSLIVCKYTCPELVYGPSRRTGWRISAVSLKPRNPALGAPDAWEQKVLIDFTRRVAGGEKTAGLETSEIVNEPQGRFFRYALAIPVEPRCVPCHGKDEERPAAVTAQLAIDYPFDRATGFSVGQLHGIISVKRPL